MRALGVEITGSESLLVILDGTAKNCVIELLSPSRLPLPPAGAEVDRLIALKKQMYEVLTSGQVECVGVIKAGRNSSPIRAKIECMIQVAAKEASIRCTLVPAQTVTAAAKRKVNLVAGPEAFELYATGRYTKIQVLKTITDKGLKTKRGHNLSAQTFDAMLRKPIYAGWVYSSTVPKIRGLHQPIITPDTFDAVQRILSGRKLANVPKRKYNPAFPLKHFVKCGNCGTPLTGGMNKGKLKHYGHYWCRNPHCTDRVSISKYVLEADFIAYLKTLKPDAATVAQFPTIASQMWKERHADKAALFKNLTSRLDEQKALKGALLRAKLRDEVSQADYIQANSEFDFEIDEITQRLKTAQLQPANVNEFLRFSKLMLLDIALAWEQASAEQRLRVQNFLFQDGISYKESTKFLNTSKPTLFQQLRDLANCKVVNGVPDGI